MEGNLASRNMMQGNNSSYGGLDLQGQTQVHHHQQNPLALHHQHNARQGSSLVHPKIQENPPLKIVSSQDYGKKPDMMKSASEEDDTDDVNDNHQDSSKGKKASQWQRVKWTDNMVRLLITSVSYISEETASEYGGGARKKFAHLQKKGKWKSVSKVMAERGHFVSPQQCEDKFNDLNKRYKRLNEILGRGTSCEVVENPSLLDVIDHVSEKSKEEVRKILSSKHLHYEEMCSYHNGNRLHLPSDPELQHSLRLALRSRDDHDESDMKRHVHDDNDELEQEADYEDRDGYEEHHGGCAKRLKQYREEDFSFGNALRSLDCSKSFSFHIGNDEADTNQLPSEGKKMNVSQKEFIEQRKIEIEEQRLHIDVQMLELEKERFKWQRFCRKKDLELETAKMEIERMRVDNKRMALELKRKELGIENN